MNDQRIGVVTVTYNSAEVLLPFMKSVLSQHYRDFILYVADNKSSDKTLDIMRTIEDSRVRVIANDSNLGVAEANNQGIQAALDDGCGSVLLINNDTEFDNTLFGKLLDRLIVGDVGMVCPKMMYFDEPDYIWTAGGKFQKLYGFRAIHRGEGEYDCGQYDESCQVTYVPTCCVLIHADVFSKIGLMDKEYFVYVDDVDFMYRALKHNIKLQYLAEAKLLHKVGRLTGGSNSTFSYRYCTRNRVYFLLKHLGVTLALPYLLTYQIYFAASVLLRKIPLSTYRIKQKAVVEGASLWRKQLRLIK